MTTYNATYRLRDSAAEKDWDTLSDLGEQELDDIIATCRITGAKATLRDGAGFVCGWVHPDGSYKLQ